MNYSILSHSELQNLPKKNRPISGIVDGQEIYFFYIDKEYSPEELLEELNSRVREIYNTKLDIRVDDLIFRLDGILSTNFLSKNKSKEECEGLKNILGEIKLFYFYLKDKTFTIIHPYKEAYFMWLNVIPKYFQVKNITFAEDYVPSLKMWNEYLNETDETRRVNIYINEGRYIPSLKIRTKYMDKGNEVTKTTIYLN